MSAVRLTLPLPPTANHYYRMVGRKMLLSSAGRAYKNRCATIALLQGAKVVPGEVVVSGAVYMARLGCAAGTLPGERHADWRLKPDSSRRKRLFSRRACGLNLC